MKHNIVSVLEVKWSAPILCHYMVTMLSGRVCSTNETHGLRPVLYWERRQSDAGWLLQQVCGSWQSARAACILHSQNAKPSQYTNTLLPIFAKPTLFATFHHWGKLQHYFEVIIFVLRESSVCHFTPLSGVPVGIWNNISWRQYKAYHYYYTESTRIDSFIISETLTVLYIHISYRVLLWHTWN